MSTNSTRLRGLWPLYLSVFIALAVVATLCTAAGDDEDEGGDPVTDNGTGPTEVEADGQPLRVRLRQGQSIAQADDPVEVVAGTPLDQGRIDQIVDRLEPFGEEGDREAFNRPAETLAPPIAGQTVEATFPPDGAGDHPTPDVPAGPLEVVRFQPEGDVDIAPSLSITFNQPMVPLATLEQLDAADVPVTVTPELDGRWRWIGTRTLRFEHTPGHIDRLPMATAYTVTVPAGTTARTGGALAEDVTFSFTTPAPTVQAVVPQGDSLVLDPVFVVVFDQIVDPATVLEHLTLDADGGRAVRLATPEEVDADDTVRPVVEQALDGRWVAFRPTEPLPADTPVAITVNQGTPSAEGPRTTTVEQRFTGRTFPPLTIVRTECGYGQGCRPGQPLLVEFSNPLDAAAFDPATVTVDPELPGATIGVQGNVVVVQGATEADTTYRVTLPAALRDDRGQTLGSEETREFDVGDPLPFLRRFDTDMITVDPLAEQPSVSLVSAGHEDLRIVALDVDPDDWSRYTALDRWSDELTIPDFPVLLDRTVETGADDGTTVETIVDLSEAFPEGSGQALLYVEPTRTFPSGSEEYWNNLPMLVWVQATTIGIDALADGERLVVWTTDLRDGSPIAGADVAHDGTTATTDADGLATFSLDSSGDPTITATVEGRTALLGSGWRERWQAQPRNDIARWYVLDDRGLYRPGETVNLKGWIRRVQLSGDASLSIPGDGATIDYQVFDGQYTEIASGQLAPDALGGFDLAVDLPEGANLGYGTIAFQLSGSPACRTPTSSTRCASRSSADRSSRWPPARRALHRTS